ncbi:MAG: divergent polysaccharide deacetylase family protein [Candidatus Dadabacteria bacterium]|nr:divergent polysaccharide deacetylase family protein [Candidatus Dadabacteria bacterium]MYE61460.1 divergent polysaccharide deacetylase family protein [Candidatus Dadabacteria bacterium]MYI73591.1 divergent polysaccharide deacetylase family protein [Candidatus Dadabacteria bacterium]
MSQKKRTRKRQSTAKTGDKKRTARLTHAVLALVFFFAFSIFGLKYIERFFDGWSHREATPTATDKIAEKEPRRPGVVLIIDDLGYDKESIDRILRIKQPLNLAVLPHLSHSLYVARAAYRGGKDVILHLPMEPKYASGYTADDAGEGVLLLGFSMDQMREELRRNIMAVPNIVGVNNHMGSKFMENEEPVKTIMRELKARGLYFVDSLTTPNSRGYSVARRLGVKVLKRDVFIDQSERGKEYTMQQLDRLVRIAEKKGIAVGIGHPYPQTIDALEEYMPKIEKKVEFMKISTAALN